MRTFKLRTFAQQDGELHLSSLPVKKSDQVDVIMSIHDKSTVEEHAEALRRFSEHADKVSFRSERPYPSRDELHERH